MREGSRSPVPLRFGILCSGTVFQHWQAEALRLLIGHGHQPVLLIVDGRKMVQRSRLQGLFHRKKGTLLYSVLENRLFKPDARKTVDMSVDLSGVAVLECQVEKKGYSEYFNEGDIRHIRSFSPDFLLRLGFGIIRGEILEAARFGVWSFHHGDEMKYRGGPAGFWEIYRGDPVSGALLQRLTDRLDGGVILRKGWLKTVHHSYRENIDRLLTVSSAWPVQVADQLSVMQPADERTPDMAGELSHTSAPILKVPGNFRMLAFLLKLFRNRLAFYFDALFRAEQWNVAVIGKPVEQVALSNVALKPEELNWLPGPGKEGYFADPFGIVEGDRLRIFFEDYLYLEGMASLAMVELGSRLEFGMGDPVSVTDPVRVLPPGLHRSYPFLLEHEGTLYCIPESATSCSVTLYKWDEKGRSLKEVCHLVENFQGVDPTLIRYNGLWWLFMTRRDRSNICLYLYHAENLTGPYFPHLQNPVKTDVRSSRPAGAPFVSDGHLYRPAQDCSLTYGGRVALNRVIRLDTERFSEEVVRYVDPIAGSPFAKGLHTISGAGPFTLIDGKRYRFDRHQFFHRLFRRNKGGGSTRVQ